MRRRTYSLLFVIGLLLISASAAARTVKVMKIDGPIGAITLKHFERAIEEAETEDAAALVVQLNTPGGVMETTLRITTEIMNARVPVIVWVAPSGGRAPRRVFISLTRRTLRRWHPQPIWAQPLRFQ